MSAGVDRRDFLKLGLAAFAGEAPAADVTLRIGEINAEIGLRRVVRTLAYNGQTPGPLLRMKEGRTTTIEVVNETWRPELVHWHGFHLPAEVDGAHEEGTPMVQGRGHRRYTFIPRPAGTRWYHTHAMAGHNLTIGSYSGLFGMAIVEPASDAGRYDLEVPIVLHEWEPFFAAATDIDYRLHSINGRMLGAGEPVRVRRGQRALFRLLNASATMTHRLALPGHTFQVIATDGNAIPVPRECPVLQLAPGERIDATVTMDQAGVWILGETDDRQRSTGAGIVIEYARAKGPPVWRPPIGEWDLAALATPGAPPDGEIHRIELAIEPGVNGNLWAINGKSFPDTDPIVLRSDRRNRLVLVNRAMMDHPVHTHRHSFEITKYAGRPIRGLRKDVVVLPAHQSVEIDIQDPKPGPSLFHCHQQFHMDFGFMALMQGSS